MHKVIAVFLVLLSALTLSSPVNAEIVVVPIKLDYKLMRQLMRNQLFNTQDGSAEVLHDPSGCNKIFLTNPELGEHQQTLEIKTHLKANVGTAVFGSCTNLFDWEGNARFLAEPVILPGARAVKLKILAIQLYNPQGELVNSGRLWELANAQLQSLLSRYVIDLNPSLDELNKLLPSILDRHSAEQLNKFTHSLHLAGIAIETEGISVDLSMQIDKLPPSDQPEAAFSEEEMQQLEAKSQMMDAMLTFAVKRYAAATHLQVLREALLEILLDARYRLRDALAMPASQEDDPVRHWFIESWQRLGPVLRQVSLEIPGQDSMALISLLTAANVLEALDKLGPSIGLDISTNGLRRMGRMLIDQPGIDPLYYDESVDPELRKLFNLPASPEPGEPSGFNFKLAPIGSARAAIASERLNLWVPRKAELPEYLPLIRDMLMASARAKAKEESLPAANSKLYQDLVMATAWQESCWRQFVIEKRKVVPLRSKSGDAGLVQINERVWRGLYNIQKLRWNISYNAESGAEILLKYLVNYALKKGEHKHHGGEDNLARAAYSAYNSGPSQISRYRNPKAAPSAKKIDAAFWEKYQLVKQGKEYQVAGCLGLEAASITPAAGKSLASRVKDKTPIRPSVTEPQPSKGTERLAAKPPSPAKQPMLSQRSSPTTRSTSKPTARRQQSSPIKIHIGKNWILAQPKEHFTLQLAVFSSTGAARKYITDTPLPGSVALAPLGTDKRGQYVVLAGSYPTRSEAEKAKARYSKLKPWVRQFLDIRAVLQ
jgi:septal ring-binding cell division protein DamX